MLLDTMTKNTKKIKTNAVKTDLSKANGGKTLAVKPVAPKTVSAVPAKPAPAAPTTSPAAAPASKSSVAPALLSKAEPRPKNVVSLELIKPEAKSVAVAGSFNGWKPEATPLLPQGNGHWRRELTVKPGRHEYLFVVDGQWLPDPNAKESVTNPFGGKNSVLIVSE